MSENKQASTLLVEDAEKTPRRRARISNKKDDHVYQANSDGQGERFDSETQKKAALNASPAIFAVDPAKLVRPKKNRGRPSKAYLAALEEYNRQMSLFQELQEQHEQGDNVLIEDTVLLLEEEEIALQPQTPEECPTEDVYEPIILNDDKVSQDQEEVEPVESSLFNDEDFEESTIDNELSEVETEEASVDAQEEGPISEEAIIVDDSFIILRDIPKLETPIPEDELTTEFLEESSEDFIVDEENAFEELYTEACGVLELEKDYGILRSADYNYMPSPDDIFISQQLIRKYGLKIGDTVQGLIRLPHGSEKMYVLTEVTIVNGVSAEKVRDRAPFESLTPLFPNEKFQLCDTDSDRMSCRIVDLIAPIGKGQRALIVAQPKTGKTMLMKDVANAIARNHPDTYLIMLLIDERPEEVTDMARTVNAEVIASTFDEPASQHVRIANIVLEKAKRMVECGRDVVIFLDSITRLARAYNTVAPTSGKILSGGVEANALQKPKRFFGAARNIEDGGSLTIIATALIDTGSKMDEVIFEEFKGTGNMELQLDRSLSNKRIFPAVNLTASSTRRDELLLDEMVQNRMWVFRNYIADMNPIEAMKFLRQRLENTRNNQEFIVSINS